MDRSEILRTIVDLGTYDMKAAFKIISTAVGRHHKPAASATPLTTSSTLSVPSSLDVTPQPHR